MNILYLIIIVLFFRIQMSYAENIDPNHLTISVGDTATTSLEKVKNIQINKKGIIDIYNTQGSFWQITGLKTGFVMVHIKEEHQEKRIFVEVLPKEKKKEQPIPDWICQKKGLRCDYDQQSVHGQTNDLTFYFSAENFCSKRNQCLFFATLNAQGMESFKGKISKLIGKEKNIEIQISETGHISLESDCSSLQKEQKEEKKNLEEILESELHEKKLSLTCKNNEEAQYTIKSKIFLVEESKLHEIGFSSQLNINSLQVSERLLALIKVEPRLTGKEQKIKVIAEPMITTTAHSLATAISGGEFPVYTENTQDKPGLQSIHWKDHGLDLKVKIIPKKEKTILLEYIFSLKNRTDYQENLQVHKLESKTFMTLEKEILAGTIELASQGDTGHALPFLSKIPIISPLFKLAFSQELKSKIFVTFYVTKVS